MTRTNDEFTARRTTFVGLALFLTGAAMLLMLHIYSDLKLSGWDYVVIGLFPLLFGQVALGFVLALLGFFDWLRGGDPFHLMRRPWSRDEAAVPLAATAIAVPVFNEDVARVRQGIENMWHSLEKTGQLQHFDFYLLSDSNQANHWVEEECAWMSLGRKLDAFGKIFYRKRRHAINGKSGNVADFCRRWGKRYRYMIVLDADSVMSGPTLVRMVRAMEANSAVGILQTLPHMVLGRSLLRRALQFTGRVYGPLFTQGCSLAQMSSGSYWGHNAIIRVAPFIEHCDLPMLPVPDPGKRHVLSHDTVEAALMRRAGYEVWIAYEEGGSYEEGPPNLSDMLKRDRRWCAGNLQHFWFLFARGIAMGSRLQIWIGLMAYLSSPLWLLFLIAGSFAFYERTRFLMLSAGPEDLGATGDSSVALLFTFTMVLLFAPRVLGLITVLPQCRRFGGFFALAGSALLEVLISMLMAPLLMIFHTFFVLSTVLGIQIKWTTQNRSDNGLTLSHCLAFYGWISCLGVAALFLATTYLGPATIWMTPIIGGWILAPFMAWITASSEAGMALKQSGIFLTPEEQEPPIELQGLQEIEEKSAGPHLWTQAFLSPYVQALHLSMVRQRNSGTPDAPETGHAALRERLIREGPQALTPKEKLRLLWDADTVFWLHQELWSRPEKELHTSWERLRKQASRTTLLTSYLLST